MAEHPDRPLPAHVTTPLLTLITERSMDEDYRQVALRRGPDGRRPPPGRPRQVAAGVIVVFGLLVTTAAVQTSRNADVDDASRSVLIARINDARAGVAGQQDRITQLQDRNIALQDRLDDAVASGQEAEARLRRQQTRTGFGPVHGPGVRITVDDPPNADVEELVRDEDLAILVDGLWNAGAEAIAINDQRLTVLTAIRNRGPGVRVNSEPVNPPYVVEAIGDVGSLQADLVLTTHGALFFDRAANYGFRVERQNVDQLSLPAAAPPRLRYVREGTSTATGKDQEATP